MPITHTNISSIKEVPFTPLFITVKLADIGYVTLLYFVLSLLFARIFNYFYDQKTIEEYHKMPLWKLSIDTVTHIFLIGVIAYILRNVVGAIPSPLDGIAGFEHNRLKELHGDFILAILLFMFQKSLHNKIAVFAKRLLGLNLPNFD